MKTQHLWIVLLLSFSKNLTAQSTIQVNSTAPAATYCQGTEITLSLAGAAGGTTYKWQSDNIKIEDDAAETPKLVLDEAGEIEIKLKINSSTTITPIKFKVNPKPTISGIKSMVQGSSITVICFDNFASGAVNYTWTHPDGVTSTTNPLVIAAAAITKQGEYQLTIKNNTTTCVSTYKHKVPEEEKKTAVAPVFGTPVSEEDELTYNYIIKRQIPVTECTINGDIINNSPTLIPPRTSRFTIIEQKDDYTIVKFWNWENKLLSAKYNGSTGNPKFFRVANDRLGQDKQVVPYHSMWFNNSISFTAGTLVVPVKLRRTFETDKKFDFSKDFSLGGFIGLRTRISHYKPHYLNIGVSLGITAVTAIKENAPKVTEAKDLAAFSWATGCVLEFDRVQVALLRGRDILSHYNQVSTGWIHNNTTWFGVGFGYAILSRPDKVLSSKGNNNDVSNR